MRDLDNLDWTNASRGAAFTVKVIPDSGQTEILSVEADGTVRVNLMVSASDSEANDELIVFLADLFQVNASNVEIIGGLEKAKKLVCVFNIQSDHVEQLLRDNAVER